MRDRNFRTGVQLLGERSLTFEAWVYHDQLPQLVDLAKSAPNTRIVLNHFGGPLGLGPYAGKSDAVFADWKTAVTRLADCPNLVCKMGGINMKMSGRNRCTV